MTSYIYNRCDKTLMDFLVNRGAGQTRKAFAKRNTGAESLATCCYFSIITYIEEGEILRNI